MNAALQAGEADHALALLGSLPQSAESHNLRCRVLLTLEHWDAAASECEQAVNMDGQNSDFHMWLARALGEKASRASFLSAYSLAKRVRGEFETAVRLNPRNAEALADLGEFDYDAPGVVGGGIDKAEAVAQQLDKVDAARAHELRGRIAETKKATNQPSANSNKLSRRVKAPHFNGWTSQASIGGASAGRIWKRLFKMDSRLQNVTAEWVWHYSMEHPS